MAAAKKDAELELCFKRAAKDNAWKALEVAAKTKLRVDDQGRLYLPDGRQVIFAPRMELDFIYGAAVMFTCYAPQLRDIIPFLQQRH